MDTMNQDTDLFFQYLREADWHTRYPSRRPEQALFEFITQNQQPIYLGRLVREHGSMQIGLLPHLYPMDATVHPENEPQMAPLFAGAGFELVPPHVLGAIINSRWRECPGNERVYAQLGTVMVRYNRSANWYRTNFVFAAEINEYGRAELL